MIGRPLYANKMREVSACEHETERLCV
jgi:hypothetical protein